MGSLIGHFSFVKPTYFVEHQGAGAGPAAVTQAQNMSASITSRPVDWHLIPGASAQSPIWIPVNQQRNSVSLLDAIDELAGYPDLDKVLRRSVELARECIGLERVGLFLLDEPNKLMRGTFGTGARGETTDERGIHFSCGATDREAHHRARTGDARWLLIADAPLVAHEAMESRMLGSGWLAATPVRSLRGPIGTLYNDTALSHTAVDDNKQAQLCIYASLLGNLVEARRRQRHLPFGRAESELKPVILQALDALNDNPSLTGERLAAELSLSPGYLARLFKSEVGVSLVEYRNRLRIEGFFRLVENGGNLLDAALKAGFGSYAQFHRVFRNIVGSTPREYLTTSPHRSKQSEASLVSN